MTKTEYVKLTNTISFEIVTLHQEICKSCRVMLSKAIRIGELLQHQKSSLSRGEWIPWIKENLPFDRHQASKYLRAFTHRKTLNGSLTTHLEGAIDTLTKPKTAHISHNAGENEWYTPPAIIEAASNVMGKIDVDPASSEIANKTVGADTYYDGKKNGLEQSWKGRVWLNPPYSQPHISQFCDVLAKKLTSGEVSEACVLVNNATETNFGQKLLGMCSAVCFPSGRIKFLDIEGKEGAPLQGQMIVYFGEQKEVFVEEFSQFGVCLYG